MTLMIKGLLFYYAAGNIDGLINENVSEVEGESSSDSDDSGRREGSSSEQDGERKKKRSQCIV